MPWKVNTEKKGVLFLPLPRQRWFSLQTLVTMAVSNDSKKQNCRKIDFLQN